MTFEDSLSFFPCGVQYHRAPTPLPSEWAGDMAGFARCGYTHVQFRPQWRWHERVHGQRAWDDLDQLFDLAAAHGLRVVLKPMLETAPDWVFSELGGTRIGYHGVPIRRPTAARPARGSSGRSGRPGARGGGPDHRIGSTRCVSRRRRAGAG